MTDSEAALWLTRLQSTIKGKYEPELEIHVALSIAIDKLQLDSDIQITSESN